MRTFSTLAAIAACAYSQKTIVQTVIDSSDHSQLLKVVLATGDGVIAALGADPLTLFAPNNAGVDAAMVALGLNISNLTAAVPTLTSVVTYHAFAAKVLAAEITTTPTFVKSLGGQPLKVFKDGSDVKVMGQNTVKVVGADIECTNGVIHSVDGVLLPPADVATVATASGLTSLMAAISKIDGLATILLGLDDLTVFAPTNAAFTAFLTEQEATLDTINITVLEKVLKYHCFSSRFFSPAVVAGGNQDLQSLSVGDKVTVKVDGTTVMVDDAKVTTTDVLIANGVVHVIDKVIMPSEDYSSAALPFLSAAALFFMALLA